ncbi:MAG: glycosyltransferase family 4 protein [Ignavibacteriaceae bacterium]
MKITHISKSDSDGGAAIAAKRICKSQQLIPDLESILLVQLKKYNDENIFSIQSSFVNKISYSIRTILDELTIRALTLQSRGRFSFPFWGADITNNEILKSSSIINLHWINGGFLSLSSLNKIGKLNKPIVWTLHDMWAFTGGCHYSSGCDRYIDHCSNCPSLLFKSDNDLSNKIFDKKRKLFDNLNLTIIACSNWLAQETSKSRLLSGKNIITIPNPIDTDLFKPINKIKAKEYLELSLTKKFVLIGAMNLKDERKGFRYLIDSLNIIRNLKIKNKLELELIVFGKLDESTLNKIPFKVHQLGKLKNENEIVMAYNAADVYVAPSLEDNLPNTVMEAMACGVPVVAYNVGGIPDMINNGDNGILAELKSAEELAKGIYLILSDAVLHKRFGISAREKVLNNFNQKLVAEKYLEVYKSIL